MSQSGHSTDPQTDSVPGRLEYASLSDIGLRRSNNQDSLAVMPAASQNLWQQRGDLFVVADGMGAHAAGELASKLSTDTVPLVYHKLIGPHAGGSGPGRRRRGQRANPQPRPGEHRFQGDGNHHDRPGLVALRGLAGPRGRQPGLSSPRQSPRTVDLRSQPGVGNASGRATPGAGARLCAEERDYPLAWPQPQGPGRSGRSASRGARRHVPDVQRRPFRPGERRRVGHGPRQYAAGRGRPRAGRSGESPRGAGQYHRDRCQGRGPGLDAGLVRRHASPAMPIFGP